MHDLARRSRHVGQRRLHEGFPHVHAHGLHPGQLGGQQALPKGIQAPLFAPVPNILHGGPLRLDLCHDGQVVLPVTHPLFIHAQARHHRRLLARQSPFDRPLLDPVGLLPTDGQNRAGAADGALQQHIDGQALEQPTEAAILLRPRHRYRLRAMLGAPDHRHPRHENRLELTAIQVPPAALLVIVDLHPLPTRRAAPERLPIADPHLNLPRLGLEFHAFHVPRGRQAQNLLVKLDIFHARCLSALCSSWASIPPAHDRCQHRSSATVLWAPRPSHEAPDRRSAAERSVVRCEAVGSPPPPLSYPLPSNCPSAFVFKALPDHSLFPSNSRKNRFVGQPSLLVHARRGPGLQFGLLPDYHHQRQHGDQHHGL